MYPPCRDWSISIASNWKGWGNLWLQLRYRILSQCNRWLRLHYWIREHDHPTHSKLLLSGLTTGSPFARICYSPVFNSIEASWLQLFQHFYALVSTVNLSCNRIFDLTETPMPDCDCMSAITSNTIRLFQSLPPCIRMKTRLERRKKKRWGPFAESIWGERRSDRWETYWNHNIQGRLSNKNDNEQQRALPWGKWIDQAECDTESARLHFVLSDNESCSKKRNQLKWDRLRWRVPSPCSRALRVMLATARFSPNKYCFQNTLFNGQWRKYMAHSSTCRARLGKCTILRRERNRLRVRFLSVEKCLACCSDHLFLLWYDICGNGMQHEELVSHDQSLCTRR